MESCVSRNGVNPRVRLVCTRGLRECLGGCESADHPKLPARPRILCDRICLFGSGSAGLGDILPTLFRFGTGDATDAEGRRSGQLDVVIEYPFSPSLPGAFGGSTNRLYLVDKIKQMIPP